MEKYGKVILRSDEFPQKIPSGLEYQFLQIINTEGEIVALFFETGNAWRNFQDGQSYAAYYDHYSGLNYEVDWETQKERDRYGICASDDYDTRPGFSNLFIPYGRLKYPYELSDQMRAEYVEIIKNEFIRSKNIDYAYDLLHHGITDVGENTKDVIELLEIFNGKDKVLDLFRKACRFIESEGIVTLEGDFPQLFTNELIDHYLEATQLENLPHLAAYLIDYRKNKLMID
jgi:hypothetical protein